MSDQQACVGGTARRGLERSGDERAPDDAGRIAGDGAVWDVAKSMTESHPLGAATETNLKEVGYGGQEEARGPVRGIVPARSIFDRRPVARAAMRPVVVVLLPPGLQHAVGFLESRKAMLREPLPPDKQEQATQTVLEQAEVLSQEWAAA